MPWSARESDECPADRPWGVFNTESGERMGCHPTEDAANDQIAALNANVDEASTTPERKSFDLIETKADDDDSGSFKALASVFGNVDAVGDRMQPGSFKDTLEAWRKSGDPIPVILSHQWEDPMMHIGAVDPANAQETDKGLEIAGKLDVGVNPVADQVHHLMRERRLKGWSFGYTVPEGGEKFENGINDISKVELVETGPTLVGANPDAELQAVKSLVVEAKAEKPASSVLDGTYPAPAMVEPGEAATYPGRTDEQVEDGAQGASKATPRPQDPVKNEVARARLRIYDEQED